MIERIYVHNYRCFENFTLDLKGKGSTLVLGRNGSGKSTLRHALSVFQDACRGGRGGRIPLTSADFTRQRTDTPIQFEVEVRLGKRHFLYAISFDWSEQSQSVRVERERLLVDGQSVLSRDHDSSSLSDGVSFSMDLSGPMLPLFNIRYAGGAVQRFKAWFSSAILLMPFPSRMLGMADDTASELETDASNFSAWLYSNLNRQPARYADIVKYLQTVLPDFSAFEFVQLGERLTKMRVYFERPELRNSARVQIDFGHLSDGEKCFFLSAAVVAFNRPENPLFCFWDEPDNHLSLPEVGQFITELRKSTSQHGQFIATSHHPEAIRRFSDENTFVFTRNSHLEPTVVRPLTELPYGTDLVRALVRGEVI